MFLPRNVNLNQVEELSWLSSPPLKFEVKVQIFLSLYFFILMDIILVVFSMSNILYARFISSEGVLI